MEARIRVVERWEDQRLKVANTTLGERVEIKEDIWTPQGKFKHLMDTESEWITTYLISNGQMVRIIEQTAQIGCPFDFTWIPWDWQKCELIYFDNRYGNQFVAYEKGVFKIHDDVELLEWEIIDDTYENEITEEDAGPPAPAVKATIVFQRLTSFYVRFIFLPSIFLV